MSEHYKIFEPRLKFFGTMNGSSKSHTNAFFCPDEETIVFLDMSLLNVYDAENIILARPALKNFYVCLTHNHYDHASGLERLAYTIKARHADRSVIVITDESLREETVAHFDNVGMRPLMIDGREYGAYDLMAFQNTNSYHILRDRKGLILPKQARPTWLFRTIPTTHSPRMNTCGFALFDQGTLVIYSGDTNQLDPYTGFLTKTLDNPCNEFGDPPIEFYLDVSTRKNPLHLCLRDVADELKVLLDKYTTMNLVLMHYDDAITLKEELDELFPELYGNCIFIAKKTF